MKHTTKFRICIIGDMASSVSAMVSTFAFEYLIPRPVTDIYNAKIDGDEGLVFLGFASIAVILAMIVGWIGCLLYTKWGFFTYIISVACLSLLYFSFAWVPINSAEGFFNGLSFLFSGAAIGIYLSCNSKSILRDEDGDEEY